MGRSRKDDSQDVDRGPLLPRGRVLHDSASLGHSQTGAEAASADVGGLQPTGKLQKRRRDGPGSSVLQPGGP